MKRTFPPALALFLIAPIFGELFSGSSPLNEYINPITFISLGLLYGCGAIIIRELILRWGKGWVSLLLLGIAYGIYEEGILVQSFFDPGWTDLGSLAVYGRAGGVNWVWTEHLLIFHTAISIAASIAFVQALYPKRRGERWVTTRGWWIANFVGVLSLLPIWKFFVKYDSGLWWIFSWLAVFTLIWLARRIPFGPAPVSEKATVHPRLFWLIGFFGTLFEFIIVYSNAESMAAPFQVILLILAIYIAFVLWLLHRLSGGFIAWDDRHRIALVNGALMLLLALVPLTSGAQYPITYITNPIFILLLWLAARCVNKRVTLPLTPATA
jgi:hypothetical protein